MDTFEWVFFSIGLILWSVFYFIYAIRQELEEDFFKNPDEKKRKEIIDQLQWRRMVLLMVHAFFYWILTSVASMAWKKNQFYEVSALSTVIIFAFLLYVGEEIGILQMDRSLNNPLPEGEDEKKDNKVYYKDRLLY